jgi:chlorite dismutase
MLDLSEKGRGSDGQPISLNRRLYMQLLAFGNCPNPDSLIPTLQDAGFDAVLYADLNDPRGVGLLVMSEDPDFFVSELRQFLNRPPFSELTLKPEYTMFGRTYSIGYESNLEYTLIDRPRQRALDPEWPWAVWYPLRRVKSFEQLPDEEKNRMLGEHGNIGRTFGKANLATDIRLACHGLDKNDNDFVVAILGHDLHPCSAVVQAMRKTQQTARWLESLGPFFIGKAIWQG